MGKEIKTSEESKKMYSEFESIILPHENALKSFAIKMTNNLDDADDLVQETLLKAFRYFDKFEKGTNAKAWLFQIMKNTFINDYRRKTREPNKVDYEDVQNFYENIKANEIKSDHFEGDAFNNVLDDNVVNALSKLPDDFRTIVFLSDIEGFSYEEISEFMNSPIGTVRSRLHRARKMLYSLLFSYAKDQGVIKSEKIENQKLNNIEKIKEVAFSVN